LKLPVILFFFCCIGVASATEPLRIAAASDLEFAMNEIVLDYQHSHPGAAIEVTYGSSGNFTTQIRQGAPFDMFFSADSAYPEELQKAGLAASAVRPYGTGRIVLWSAQVDASKLRLEDLADSKFAKVAIANPRHAPYGQRAEEALRAARLWDAVEPKLVYGENIAQTAQFVESGNAQIGIIALSLALNPAMAGHGGYFLIPDSLHAPLVQAFIITRRAAGEPLATDFANYFESAPSRATLARYGFER
jgi:molybdate transport system substrate-binding protein